MNDKHVLAMTVKNHAGVLARISSLFGRRGYNIDSVSSSPTNEGTVSRITMVVRGDESILQQLMLQTAKLEEVIRVSELSQEKALYRELLMVKVFADEKTRTPIREICDIYGAKIIDLSINTMVAELTGTPQKIDAFMEVLGQYPIAEMSRTGATALERGFPALSS